MGGLNGKVTDDSGAPVDGVLIRLRQGPGFVELVDDVSRQQAQGIDQVSQALTQMERVTQGNAATAEESAAASEELTAQAETALTLVGELDAMVAAGADEERGPPPSTPARHRKWCRSRRVPRKPRRHHERVHAAMPERRIPFENTGTFGSF